MSRQILRPVPFSLSFTFPVGESFQENFDYSHSRLCSWLKRLTLKSIEKFYAYNHDVKIIEFFWIPILFSRFYFSKLDAVDYKNKSHTMPGG